MNLKHFKLSEFDSKDQDGSGAGTGSRMQASTLEMLDNARRLAGVHFVINSGYRTAAHNKRVKGSKNSSHMRGYAVDIRTSPATQQTIVNALKAAGFRRIGIYRTFVHADNDPSLPTPAEWRG